MHKSNHNQLIINPRNIDSHQTSRFSSLKPLIALLLAAIIFSGCGGPVSKLLNLEPKVDTAALNLLTISNTKLSRAGLHEEWNLPIIALGANQQINQFFYWKGILFAIDNYCNLYAIDGHSGMPLWSQPLSQTQTHCSAPGFYQDNMLFAVGRMIIEIRSDGKIINKQKLNFSPSTTVARNKHSYFLGSNDKRFYCLGIGDGVKSWQNISPDTPTGHVQIHSEPIDKSITDTFSGEPIVPFEKVFYTDRSGGVHASLSRKREIVWSKETSGVAPGIIVNNNQCFMPSSDTILYCYKSSDGELLWRYMANAPLSQMPTVSSKYIYQSVGHNSLVCLNRKSNRRDGNIVWNLKNGKSMLAEHGSSCYAITHDNELSVIDNQTGRHKISFYLPGVEISASNTEDNMIFLATRRGTIVALKPDR